MFERFKNKAQEAQWRLAVKISQFKKRKEYDRILAQIGEEGLFRRLRTDIAEALRNNVSPPDAQKLGLEFINYYIEKDGGKKEGDLYYDGISGTSLEVELTSRAGKEKVKITSSGYPSLNRNRYCLDYTLEGSGGHRIKILRDPLAEVLEVSHDGNEVLRPITRADINLLANVIGAIKANVPGLIRPLPHFVIPNPNRLVYH